MVLAAIVGCGDAAPSPPPPPPVVYTAGVAPWPAMPAGHRIGRGVAPARAAPVAITAEEALAPIVPARIHAVPGDGEARAVVAGTVGDALVVELIGVDDGVIRWRDTTGCQAPVVHVTADVVVCGDATHLVALTIATGEVAWQQPWRFAGAEGDLIVARSADDTRVAVIAAAGGTVVAEVTPPGNLPAKDVRRACAIPGGVELWSWSEGGALVRFEVTGGASVGAPSLIALGRAPARLDACADPALLELPIPGSSERELLVLGRAPFAVTAGPLLERGFWRDGAGGVVVATARGIEVRDAALALQRRVSDAEVGRELAVRGARRLVRGAGGVPVLLVDDRPVASLSAPAHLDSAVLGDRHVLGGSWQAPARSFADRVQRFLLPEVRDDAPAPAVAPVITPDPPSPPVISLDLPPEQPAAAPPIELAGAGHHDVGLVFLDPADPARLYAAPLEERPDAQRGAGLAALDLRTRSWTWHAPEGCPPGMPVAVAVAAEVIVCGSRGSVVDTGAVRAVDRDDGAIRWTWTGTTVDAVVAAGGIVAVTVGRRAVILDAATGAALAGFDADDGFVPRLIATRWQDEDAVIAVERGMVVARLPRAGMLPVWATAVDGIVLGVAVAGDRVTVELSGGELYLLDPGTGAAVAAGGWARRWRVLGGSDLVLAEEASADEWRLHAFGGEGAPRFAVGLAVEPPWQLGVRGRAASAALPLSYGPASRAAALLDPRTGFARARFLLPDRAVPGAVFATVVDGVPVAGAILARPLAAVLF